MTTRRSFLKFVATLSGAAGASALIPESIRRAYAIEPEPGSSYLDAEHIVILMQENRSFDHALGTLRGVRGFNDPRALRLGNGNSVFVQADAAGNSYGPWRLDIHDTRITWMGSIPHSRHSQVDAWNEGHHDGWIEAKRSHIAQYAHLPLTMGYYTREDLPFYYALADAFTVCDQNYCSVMTSTTPNRSCFWTGTVRDRQNVDSKAFVRNEDIERGGMTWKTFPERLQEAGISWKFYQNELTHARSLSKEEEAWLSNFGCNVLENFSAYNVDAHEAAADDSHTALTPRQRALHDAAFVTNTGDPNYRALADLAFEDAGGRHTMQVPRGDLLYQFRKDVNEGKLPTISWLTAPEKLSDHPTSPWYGAWYVSEIVDILTKDPVVWKKTIFILTYDENDGYFDHAPSYVAADPQRPETGGASAGVDTGIEYTYAADEVAQGTDPKRARSGPIGLGFRVPMIVASPWSRGGWVNSQLFDHTSTLMFLEQFVRAKFGKTVTEENISSWRRCISGNLTSVFRSPDASEPALDYLDRNKFVVSIQRARYKKVPSNYRKLSAKQINEINRNSTGVRFMAHQEAGTRPSCALPYELYVDGDLSADRTRFLLRMKVGDAVHGTRSAGAPLNLYLRNLAAAPDETRKRMQPATYAIKAGDAIEREFPLSLFAGGRYVLDVHAPNGFYRSFAGTSETPAIRARVEYEKGGISLTGNVNVNVENASEDAVLISVVDQSYGAQTITKGLAAGQQTSMVLDLARSHCWYDFSLTVGNRECIGRFAGRVETGKSSVSDPVIGSGSSQAGNQLASAVPERSAGSPNNVDKNSGMQYFVPEV